ncbi:MAG TPA: nitroreductase family protein [Chloroflexota bacterium]|nr:nitroreductase family protein [Chloroflexota bacterium]
MAVAAPATTEYDLLLDIIKRRASVRKLKPDPVPDEYITKILEAAHWAMSGANSQPWEFIVVKDPQVKKDLFQAYTDINQDFIFWMEQQREFELRHPSYQLTHDEAVMRQRLDQGWSQAPVLIAVLGDGRRQWGTVMGAMTYDRGQTHLTDGLANAETLIHLTAKSLGLSTQHVTIHVPDPFKRILGVPDLIRLHDIIPVGYADVDPMPGVRRELGEFVHHDRYEMSKYMTNEQVIEYLYSLRKKTIPKYRQSYAGKEG